MSGEKKLKNINFFICSTYIDLKAYREAIIKEIDKYAGVINAQEFFGARDQKPIETCLEEVRKSQIFILILGMRYGSIEKEKNKSFVEIEYEEAKKLDIPIFAYIIDENYQIPIVNVDRNSNAIKLDEFKKRIQNDFTVEKFTSPIDLADKVINDLLRELPKKGFPINESAKKITDSYMDSYRNIKDIITFFISLPKIYYGKEFSIDVEFEGFERASKTVCKALSLTYGASIKRKILPKDKTLIPLLGSDLRAVYAQYELAEKLIRYKAYSDATIKVRTTQGNLITKTPVYSEKYNNPWFVNYNKKMVISDYETSEELLIGLELIEIK